MSILAFVIGLAIPTASGYLLLRLCEASSPVLSKIERVAAGCILGTTLSMAIVFMAHITTNLPLNRTGFLSTEIASLGILLGLFLWRRPHGETATIPTSTRPRWEIAVWILLSFAVLKTIIAAITFLLLTPTYLDDTLDNWNLRGKVFFETERLELVMPGEDPLTSPLGVSSYPPAVPLIKASLAAIAGEWTDPLVNAIHGVWFLVAAVLLYCAVRRRFARHWALLAAYLYLCMPLATMHGTNPYADVFVSTHVFLAASWLLDALTEKNPAKRSTWFVLLGIAVAALSFTKNEGIIVYLPPIALILIIWAVMRLRDGSETFRSVLAAALRVAIPLACIALPWLLFKWSNGLTFGNAKAIGDLSIYWRDNVLLSVIVNTFFEGNWLLLFPALIALLAWRRHAAWNMYLPLTAFIVIVYVGQLLLFLFTNLAVEALMQTGYARGIIQLLPCIVLLTAFLLKDTLEEPLADER